MTGLWKLNGIKLTGASVSIHPTSLQYERGVRQSLEAIHGGTQRREKLGLDLPTATIEISFFGRGSTKFTELTEVLDVLDDDEVWTLQAPTSNANAYVYRNKKRAAFSTRSWSVDQSKAPSRVTLRIEAITNGAWIADGGTYCEKVTGYFTLTSTGPSAYTRDDETNTGSTPLVRLPEQTSGYPLAVRASDFAEAQPTLSATTSSLTSDGNTIFHEDYDFTGFLIPEPTTAGDVGLYEVCSSPTDAYLSGGEGLVSTTNGGMASFAMASQAMAST